VVKKSWYLAYKATPNTPVVEVGVGVAQLQPLISYCPACFGYLMKAASIKEYQNKFQPDMPLYIEKNMNRKKIAKHFF
jgi:hypothetical protein